MNGTEESVNTTLRRTLHLPPFQATVTRTTGPPTRYGSLGQGEILPGGEPFATQLLYTANPVAVPPEAAPVTSTSYPEILRQGGQPGGFVLLQEGDQGPPVASLQQQLRRLGFPQGAIDSVYGPVTTQAVKLFQSRANLPVTGTLDDLTWAVMQAAASPTGGATSAATSPPAAAPPAAGSEFLGVPGWAWAALAGVVFVLTRMSPRPGVA